ncbi:hypothetical protein N9Y00_07020 [Tateyamaria sp.]|nr:hypothetical protein [Tateyamaria sp.]
MNIFETASRKKTRFPSKRGELTAEQLWDLPLTQLDVIARGVNSELKGVSEESFIATSPDPRKPGLELQLDILKHVIKAKQEEADAAKNRAAKAAKRKTLMAALADREAQEMAGKSKDTILKELEELDA